MKISPDLLARRGDLTSLRREFHSEPELAFEETRTADRVARYLDGVPLRRGVGRTGIVASLGKGSPTVLLRVDMDALPLQERNTVPYASKRNGVMHACGHDGHTAMGAVAARVLRERELKGSVKVLFQPAEEGIGGAAEVIRDGVLDGVDRVFGIHLWNQLPVGTLGVKAGPLMAAVDGFGITIRGHGGHGAIPQLSDDPVVAAAHVVTGLQTIVSREVSPLAQAVVTIGSIHGGEAFNVIPDEVVMKGTFRTFDLKLRLAVRDKIQRIASRMAESLRCTALVEFKEGNPAVVNDPASAEIAHRAAVEVVGEGQVVEPEPTMGGEDMALYFDQVPGCFVFVGSSNADRGLTEPHHSPTFDFDEGALEIGCQFLLAVAGSAIDSSR